MPAVHLDCLSFRHTSAVAVLDGVSAHLGPGWTGVVGANGAGKTTLLRLIAGDLVPTGGRVGLDPGGAAVALVAQTVESPGEAVPALAASWEADAAAIRGRLALDPDEVARWSTLSPGERKRWQVAAALVSAPDVLLLDEPTNHLDADGRQVLRDALRRFDGVGLVVSHDRGLLDDLTVRTLHLERGTATLWSGGYSVARDAWTAEQRLRVEERDRLRRRRVTLDRRVADQRRAAEAKRAAFTRQQRTSSQKDIDARSAMAQRRFRSGDKAAADVLAATVGRRDRLDEQLAAATVAKELGGRIFVGYERSPKRLVAQVSGQLEAAGEVLVDDLAVAVERHDRVWLRGPNGAGKSTLLARLRSASGLSDDRLLWLPQDLTTAEESRLLEGVRRLDPAVRGRVLAVVAALGVDPDVLLASDRPSPGEARKLAMALGLGRQAWLALLDEPTNHLDLPSIERLEAALVAYPGALVVVSHDTAFAEHLGLETWLIDDRSLVLGSGVGGRARSAGREPGGEVTYEDGRRSRTRLP